MGKDEDLKIKFEQIVENIWENRNSFDEETLLKLYGYYKQAINGDCNTKPPFFLNFKEKSKWEAWNENKGMKQKHAMKQYINMANDLLN